MKLVNVNVDQMQASVIMINVGIIKDADVNVKDSLTKGRCTVGFIWNPSTCEYEYDKSCDVR